eukprot:6197435-Pleurochrysis_carterae.AAC.2
MPARYPCCGRPSNYLDRGGACPPPWGVRDGHRRKQAHFLMHRMWTHFVHAFEFQQVEYNGHQGGVLMACGVRLRTCVRCACELVQARPEALLALSQYFEGSLCA